MLLFLGSIWTHTDIHKRTDTHTNTQTHTQLREREREREKLKTKIFCPFKNKNRKLGKKERVYCMT